MSQPVAGPVHLADPASGCPINLIAELLGDRWSFVVLRDLMFTARSGFRELLAGCDERIASNVLASRLTKLVDAGLLTRRDDPGHRQKVHYRLTEPAIQLVPVLAAMGLWAANWLPADPQLSAPARHLAEGGPEAMNAFMDELRLAHLGLMG
jgi:DNA-binding HxlR family transcriptional regulator